MTATITILKRPDDEYYMPCKCGHILWALVIKKDDEGDFIKQIVCGKCGAVFEFGDESIEMEFE